MHWELEITLFVVLIIAALISLAVRSLLTAVVTLTVFSFASALLYIAMGAVDVGFTEAVVGGGAIGVFMVILIFKTLRKENLPTKVRLRGLSSSLLNYVLLTLFCGLLIFAAASLPSRGDPASVLNDKKSPAGSDNAASFYVTHAYEDTHTPNMVTAILADYRGYDTLGEETVILTAGLICFLLLRRGRKDED
ncbi:hydrogen gas-evolving membrane-bound hydrogenase subunit E [Acidobacteriota bacterium]